VSPLAGPFPPCPRCGKTGNLRWQWKPDAEPTRERVRCYACGWDTDWIKYGTIGQGLREAGS